MMAPGDGDASPCRPGRSTISPTITRHRTWCSSTSRASSIRRCLERRGPLKADPTGSSRSTPTSRGSYGAASPRQVIECFDPQRYELLAAVDRLALIPGVGVQFQAEFRPLAEQDPSLLAERFFLIARASTAAPEHS